MKIFISPIFLLIFSIANGQDKNLPDNRLDKLEWIADRWVYVDSQGVTYENWVKERDDSFTGEAFTVKNGDTVFSEQLKIKKTDDDIFYIGIVKHNPGPVSFKLVEIRGKRAVFENPEYDFPNRIIYELKNSYSLYARIEGKDENGKTVMGEYFYTRAR